MGLRPPLWRLSGPSPIVEVSPRHRRPATSSCHPHPAGIPTICHGGAANGFVSRDFLIFPTPIGLAAMWDPGAAADGRADPTTDPRGRGASGARTGSRVASETPRGRAHETYSNDPYLLSALGLAYVRGLRIDDATTGVAATTKHFVGYSASEGGLNTATTHLGSHKLHDLYAPPFEAAVGDGGLQSVIDSHSPVDDIPVAASRAILTDSLGGLAFPAWWCQTTTRCRTSSIHLRPHSMPSTRSAGRCTPASTSSCQPAAATGRIRSRRSTTGLASGEFVLTTFGHHPADRPVTLWASARSTEAGRPKVTGGRLRRSRHRRCCLVALGEGEGSEAVYDERSGAAAATQTQPNTGQLRAAVSRIEAVP